MYVIAAIFAVAIGYLVTRFFAKKKENESHPIEEDEVWPPYLIFSDCEGSTWKFGSYPEFGNEHGSETYVELQGRKGALKAAAVLDEIQAEIKMKKSERRERVEIIETFVKRNIMKYYIHKRSNSNFVGYA